VLKGTAVQVWFYVSEPEPEKALKEIEKLIDNGLKRDHYSPNIKYVAEVLR